MMLRTPNTAPKLKTNKVVPILEKNYANNLDSDYTEKIEALDKNFDYSSNSHDYWSEPEHSLLYGTPLYQEASPAQKLALNHLHWILFYKRTADSETELIYYNTITADCLRAVSHEYKMLVDLLAHETAQERKHIHAFYKVNSKTTRSLFGKKALLKPASKEFYSIDRKSFQVSNYLFAAEKFIAGMMLQGKDRESFLDLNHGQESNQPILLNTQGFFNGLSENKPDSRKRFFYVNWANHPFLAANYYAVRYQANLALKNHEFGVHKYYKKLQKNQDFIPTPTTISHYHFLDEAFHTTTSLFLGRDFYRYLPPPSIYEKVIANLAVLRVQYENFNSLSGISTHRFLSDGDAISFLMKLLQSPVFSMSSQEAIHWIEKCLCHEHEGFHVNLKVHDHLLSDLRKFAQELDYLWPVNREMRVMAAGGSISKAIKKNTQAFKQFMNTMNS